MHKQIALSLSLFFALSACATPEVDQTTATFNETTFTSDLNICRGGTFIEASAKSIGIAVLGSAYPFAFSEPAYASEAAWKLT